MVAPLIGLITLDLYQPFRSAGPIELGKGENRLTGNYLIYLSLVCLSGLLLISVGTAFIIHCCRRHQDPIQPPPPTLLPTQPSAKGDEQSPDDDGAVHYAAVNFKMKKAADSSTSAALATDNLTPEEDSVIYADVALATGIRR